MGREGGHAHRDQRPLRGGQRPHGRQELVGARPVDRPGAAPGRAASAERPLAAVLALLRRSTSRRRTSPSTSRLVAEGDRPIASARSATVVVAAVGEDVEGRELGEPEPQVARAGRRSRRRAPATARGPSRPAPRSARSSGSESRPRRPARRGRPRRSGRSAGAGRRPGHAPGRGHSTRPACRRCESIMPCERTVAHRSCNNARARTFGAAATYAPPDADDRATSFPGQGSQSVGMGQRARRRSPAAAAPSSPRPTRRSASRSAGSPSRARPRSSTGPRTPSRRSSATSIAYLEAVRERWAPPASTPTEPLFAAGHSMGQYSALVAAGALALADGLRLVRERGRRMQASARAGRRDGRDHRPRRRAPPDARRRASAPACSASPIATRRARSWCPASARRSRPRSAIAKELGARKGDRAAGLGRRALAADGRRRRRDARASSPTSSSATRTRRCSPTPTRAPIDDRGGLPGPSSSST